MSRQTIIDIAASQVGTKENPPGSNMTKYGEWFGLNGYKWCAIFVSWVYDHAGYSLGDIDTGKGYVSAPAYYRVGCCYADLALRINIDGLISGIAAGCKIRDRLIGVVGPRVEINMRGVKFN